MYTAGGVARDLELSGDQTPSLTPRTGSKRLVLPDRAPEVLRRANDVVGPDATL
jgi:hypothetical protein